MANESDYEQSLKDKRVNVNLRVKIAENKEKTKNLSNKRIDSSNRTINACLFGLISSFFNMLNRNESFAVILDMDNNQESLLEVDPAQIEFVAPYRQSDMLGEMSSSFRIRDMGNMKEYLVSIAECPLTLEDKIDDGVLGEK